MDELIDYLYEFNVRSDIGIEEMAEDIMAMFSKTKSNDRAIVPLKAARDLLQQQSDNNMLYALAKLVYYDECECDGYCLIDDINAYLECGE